MGAGESESKRATMGADAVRALMVGLRERIVHELEQPTIWAARLMFDDHRRALAEHIRALPLLPDGVCDDE